MFKIDSLWQKLIHTSECAIGAPRVLPLYDQLSGFIYKFIFYRTKAKTNRCNQTKTNDCFLIENILSTLQ